MISYLVNYLNYEYVLNSDILFQENKKNYENLTKIININDHENSKYYIYYLILKKSNQVNKVQNNKFHISLLPYIFKYSPKIIEPLKALNIVNNMIISNEISNFLIYLGIVNKKYLKKNKILTDYLIMQKLINTEEVDKLKLGLNTNFLIKKIKTNKNEKLEIMIKNKKPEKEILERIVKLNKSYKENYLNKLSFLLLKNNYYYCYKKLKENKNFEIDELYVLNQVTIYFTNNNMSKELSYLLDFEYKYINNCFYNISFILYLISKNKLNILKVFNKYNNVIPCDIFEYNIDNISDKKYFTKTKLKKIYISLENTFISKNINNIIKNFEKLGVPINYNFANCFMNFLSDEKIIDIIEKNLDLEETIEHLIFYRKWEVINYFLNKNIITKEYYFNKYKKFIEYNLRKYINNSRNKYIIKQQILLNIIKIIKYNFFKFKLKPKCTIYNRLLFLFSLSIKNINFSIKSLNFRYTTNDINYLLDNYSKIVISNKLYDYIDIIDIYFLLKTTLKDKNINLNFRHDVIKLQNIILRNYEIIKKEKLEYFDNKNILDNFTFRRLFTHQKIEIIIFLFEKNKITISLENLFNLIYHINESVFVNIFNKIKTIETDIDYKFFKYIIYNNISYDKIIFMMNKFNIVIDYKVQIISFIKLIRNNSNQKKYDILNFIKKNYKYMPIKLYNYIIKFIEINKYFDNEIVTFLTQYISDIQIIQVPEKNFCQPFLLQIAESIYTFNNINKNNENDFLIYI